MQQYDEQWSEDQQSGGTLGDGDYQAVIVESRVTQDSETLDFTWVQRIQSRDKTAPGSVRKWYNFDSEIGRRIAAQDAANLGYTGPLSGLQAACEAEVFIGTIVEIRVKTNSKDGRDYKNVYINRVLGKDPHAVAENTPDPVPAASDDDIPF